MIKSSFSSGPNVHLLFALWELSEHISVIEVPHYQYERYMTQISSCLFHICLLSVSDDWLGMTEQASAGELCL